MQISPCAQDDVDAIIDGLNLFNLSKVPALADTWTPLDYVAKDGQGVVIGGVLGGIGYWNGLEIKILWVDESYRGKGIGSQLLEYVESLAISKGATISILDTFDFQAERFYLKHGYQPIGKINNFPEGHYRVFFEKRFV